MVPDPSSPDKTDESKDRGQLILELQKLREANARQAEVIARYVRLNKDKKKPVADVYEELEIQRELVASLGRQLRGKQEDFEARREAHEAALEELRLGLEEQSKFEETLRESAAEYRQIVECTNDGIVIVDKDWKITFANEQMARMLGYSPEELLGRTGNDFTDPEWKKWGVEKFSTRKQGLSERYEMKYRRKDGSVLWTLSYGKPIYDDTGEFMGSLSFHLDITGRKRAEEALRESARALEEANRQKVDILESISDCFYALDRDLRFTYVNKAAEEIWGLARADLIGRKIEDVFAGRIDVSLAKFRQVLEEQIPQYYEVYSKVIHRWGDMGVYPTRDGISVYFRDTTEHKVAEEALRESEERFRRVFDNAAIGILIADANRNYHAVNDRFCEMMGRSRDELLASGCGNLLHPDDQAGDIEDVGRLLRGEVPSFTRDMRYIRSDGAIVWVRVNVSRLPGREGEGLRLIAIMEDITERKRAEEELKAAKHQAELYLDLMGHDINNLHQIALGYLELARELPPGEEQARFLDKPVEVLQRSAQLIKNVRKLQKLRDGVFRSEEVDVCKVLGDVQREFGANPDKTVTLNLNGLVSCQVRANDLLHDVYANLVSNAIKHTGNQADIVADLDVVADNGNRYCRVMVEDDGPGIPDSFKGKIFHRMLKGNNSAKGMGLGLYLVKSLVESYGGRVWVEDRIIGDHAQGARFVVLLPVVEK